MAAIDFTDSRTWTIRYEPTPWASAKEAAIPAILGAAAALFAVLGMLHRIELAPTIVSILSVAALLLGLLTVALFIPPKIRSTSVSEATRVAAATVVADYRRLNPYMSRTARRQAEFLLRSYIGALTTRDTLGDVRVLNGKLRTFADKFAAEADADIAATQADWDQYVSTADIELTAALAALEQALPHHQTS